MTQGNCFRLASLGHVCDTTLGKMLQTAPRGPEDQEVSYLRAGSLDVLPDTSELPTMFAGIKEMKDYSVRGGDLLVAEGGDAGRAEFVPESIGRQTILQNSLHRVRLRSEGDIRFVRYALMSIHCSGYLDVLCNKTTFGHLTVEKLRNLRIPWPSPCEQRQIADALDFETARIDALISKKYRLIELLDEHKKLLCEEALADFRQSEQLVPLKYLVSESDERQGLEVDPTMLSVSIHHGVVARGSVSNVGSRAENISDYKLCMPGDIVINRMRAFQGGVGVVNQKGIVSPDYTVLQVGNQVSANYLHFVMRSSWFVSEMTRRLRGIGSTDQGQVRTPRINFADLGLIRVPVPPIECQNELALSLTHEETRLAHVVDLLSKQLDALTELREALITAVVSGATPVPAVTA